MEEKITEFASTCNPEEVTEVILDDCPAPPKLARLQQFKNAEYISLKNCNIVSLKGFPKLPNLKKLDLSSNGIISTLFFLHGCPQLTHLNLSNNKIKIPGVLRSLAKHKNLQSLQLVNCEVTKEDEYRKKVFYFLKFLKDLDGEDKTAEDGEMPKDDMSRKRPERTDDPMNGNPVKKAKKRKLKAEEVIRKKVKISTLPQKNCLMQLNELKPGLKYIVESVSGPAHNPEFVVSVEVNDIKYRGQGTSKQLAKHDAARVALSSFVQFRNTPEAMTVMSNRIGSSDFTTDNVENEGSNYNMFGARKNGGDSDMKMECSEEFSFKKSAKSLTEAERKNPVMLLNEIHPGLEYKLLEENSSVPSQRFHIAVEVDGKTFEGYGPNKKQAKASAARSVLSNLYEVSYNAYPVTSSDPADAELFNFPQAIADKIAKQLMSTFNDVMAENGEFAKWKIIAGIAMTKDEAMEDIQIIGLGTGTKCINGEHISMVGANLNDCHAEIISRRCLKDFLYTNLELHLEGEGDQSIFMKRENGGFTLRPHVKFHLYISTAPCGDARIFCPHEDGIIETVDRHPNRNSRGVLRTKIESGEGTIPIKSSQGVQTWDGILPGQERLLTMSCSDKIASWNVLGLQGALLSHFMEPIYLESVILGGLFHPNHLPRALFKRFEKKLKTLPSLFRLNKPKMCATSSPESRQLVKSPNFSVNWTHGLGRAEVVNAVTGKTEGGQISRLAKRSFFQRFMNIYERLPHIDSFETPQPGLYAAFKAVVKPYQAAKEALTKAFVDAGLGNWVKKPVEQNDFELVF